MLDYGKITFSVFLGIFILFSLLTLGSCPALIFGYVDATRGILGSVIGVAGSALGITQIRTVLLEGMRRTILPSETVGKAEEQLKRYCRNRLDALPGLGEIKDDKSLTILTDRLMLQFLRYLEELLKIKTPSVHFEISVLANVQEPEIICYWDSKSSDRPSSASARANDPEYYRKKKYEAVELLERPDEGRDVRIISCTEDAPRYSFVDKSQKRRIKSTCLCSFPGPEPVVIVLVADQSGIFKETDRSLRNLLPAALMAVVFELSLRKAIKISESVRE